MPAVRDFSKDVDMTRSFILPGQPTRYARDVLFKIDHTRLDIEPDFEKKSIAAKVAHKIRGLGEPISSVELDAGDLEFISAKVNGKKANFEERKESIKIDLGFTLEPDAPVEVEIEYRSTPKKGLYFRGPNEKFPDRFVHLFTQTQAEDSKYWFPCYDYPNMKFTSEVLVRAPAKMVAVSNGRLVSVESQGEKRLWHFSQEVPHSSYLLSLIVGDFEKISETHDGVSLEYYFPSSRRQDVDRTFQKTSKMMDFYKDVTGHKYPYPKYAQSIVADFMVGGMENITATTLTDRLLHDERAHLDYQSDDLISHELAHQWFGDYLTCKDWSHAWLNEGFATYFNALFREHDRGWEDFQYTMFTDFRKLSEEVEERYQRQIVEKRYWHPDELFDTHTYEKGSWVLNGIRGLIGDESFRKATRKYVEMNKHSLVETSDFRKILEDVSGLSLEPFFEQWLYSPGFPDYAATYSFDEAKNISELQLEQLNAGTDGVPLFTNPIDLVFTFKDNSKMTTRITMNERKSSFLFSHPQKPVNVSIDPKNWILKKLKFQKPKAMFLYQLANDENSAERIRAAEALSEYKTGDVIDALAVAIESDKFWGVQFEAADNLGRVGTKEALDALLEKKDHKEHRARRGVAKGLRHFAHLEENERAIDALIKYLETDISYYVRAYSAESLGYYKKSQRAFDAIAKAIGQDSVNDVIRYRAFLGFREMNDTRAYPIAKEYLKSGKYVQGRAGAAEAIGKVGKGNPDALELLLSMQYDHDLKVRNESAGAIAYLENASAIPELEAWLSREDAGFASRRLRETINLLKQGSLQSEKVASMEEKMQDLVEKTRKLDAAFSAIDAKKSQS